MDIYFDNRSITSEILPFLNFLVSIATLLVTIYFTRQLVKNDNKRQAFATRELLGRNLKTQLASGLNLPDIEFRMFVHDMVKQYPKQVDLIVEAFQDLRLTQAPVNRRSIEDFNKMLASILSAIDSVKNN